MTTTIQLNAPASAYRSIKEVFDLLPDACEFNPRLDRWYVFFSKVCKRNSHVCIEVSSALRNGRYVNPFLTKDGKPDTEAVNKWVENQLIAHKLGNF